MDQPAGPLLHNQWTGSTLTTRRTGHSPGGVVLDPAIVLDPILVIDAESFSHPVYVIEIRDHLDATRDSDIVETRLPETFDVVGDDLRRVQGELDPELDEGFGGGVESRSAPIGRNPVNQLMIVDLGTEVV